MSVPVCARVYLFIYFSTDIDNTSNTNKNNKMPAKDRKAPEGTLLWDQHEVVFGDF